LSSIFKDIRSSGTSGKEVSTNCPFCERNGKTKDDGGHLYINLVNHRYICHRCSTYGQNIYSAIPELKYDPFFSESDILEYLEREDKVYYNLDEVSRVISDKGEIRDYAYKRGLTDDTINRYSIREGIGDYKGRLVVPNFELGTGKCDYFISRAVGNSKMKYRNTSSKRISILMNFDRAVGYDINFVCEGWFTGFSFGDNFVAYLSSIVTRAQAMKISILKEVFLCPDGDVSPEIIFRNIRMLLRYRERVFLVPIPRIPKFDADNLTTDNKILAYNSSKQFTQLDLLDMDNSNKYKLMCKNLEVWYNSIFPL